MNVEILEKIIEYNLLNDEGIIVCEYEFNCFKDNYNGYIIKNRKRLEIFFQLLIQISLVISMKNSTQ